MSENLTAWVIDDHPLVARGIADFLVSHCGFASAGSATSAAEFLAVLDTSQPPSLLVMDFWLPDGVSLALIKEMNSLWPTLPILVISADDDLAVLKKVQASAARGFLHKQEAPEVFARAVSALLAGETWCGSDLPHKPAASAKDLPVTAEELGLTARQGEILALLLQGQPNKRIANTLSLSEQTVKEHVSRILERLGARNRIEIITKFRGRRLENP